MLTFDQLDSLPDTIVEIYDRYQMSVIKAIAQRIANMSYASAAWQVQRLNEAAATYEDILKKLAATTKKSEAELRKIFKKYGVKAVEFDDSIYRRAGFEPVPLNQSPAMMDVLRVNYDRTAATLRNLTSTTAITGQQSFIDAVDLAYMQISTGAFDYDTAIKNAVLQVASEGVKAIRYRGGAQQIDVSVRRAVLTGVGLTSGRLTEERARQMNVDLYRTSAHIGARNQGDVPENHEKWQGRVFSRTGKGYPNFYDVTGFGTGPGLCGWNCRHSFYPFFEGVSVEAYSQATLDEYAKAEVTYRGQEMSFYEATQKQRSIERHIREWKRQAVALEAAGKDNLRETMKVRSWQKRMREFIRDTGLNRQYEREQVLEVT